jgi:hypothetical protein
VSIAPLLNGGGDCSSCTEEALGGDGQVLSHKERIGRNGELGEVGGIGGLT